MKKHIYVEFHLLEGAVCALPTAISHRLKKVLRMKKGETFAVFNGKDGLFEATLLNDACTEIQLGTQLAELTPPTTKKLYVGLLKKEAMDTVLRQATEMGVTEIQPLVTDFTVPTKLNIERAFKIVVEAAEQCERLDIPPLHTPMKLKDVTEEELASLAWCAERSADQSTKKFKGVLVGPEGGFSPAEKERLRKICTPISLGSTILRADTAVVAGLAKI